MTSTPDDSQSSRPPNLLAIVVDCLRADRCPTDGPSDLQGWERLRSGGTTFSQTISSASWTPVCFASLLTGEYSFVHGVRTIRGPALNPNLPTLATALQEAGYSTHAFMTGPMLDVLGTNRGFDEYDHRERDVYVYDEWGQRFSDRFAKITAQAKPWFILLHLFEVHCPRQTRGQVAKEHSVREYDLAWREMDKWIAGLLDKVPANTLTALTADHGESILRRADHTLLGHVGRKMHANFGGSRRAGDWRRHGYHVFDEITRIPWAICGPGVSAGTVIGDQVRQVDIAPTLLELLGCPMPSPACGRSVAGLLRGLSMPAESAYVESGSDDPLRNWHGLRSDDWKYVEHPRNGENLSPEAMLFDLQSDPDERRNVIRKHPELAIRMRHQLDDILFGTATESAGQAIAEEDQARLAEQLKALGYI